MTVRETISAIRLLIKKYDDDSNYTPSALYHFLRQSANKIKRQKLDNNKYVSSKNFNTFKVPLEYTSITDCTGLCEEGLFTKIDIPDVLADNNGNEYLKVTDMKGNELGKSNPCAELDPILSGSVSYERFDDKLKIENAEGLKWIKVTGVWEDLSEWVGKELCGENGSTNTCKSIMDMKFPIDESDSINMYKLTLDLLRFPTSVSEIQTLLDNAKMPT